METINNLSFGLELEWSDIDRKIDIPEELGEWEGPKVAGYYLGSELDIVNTKGVWKGHGTDPLCINCPVGGEIHTQPSYTIESQMLRFMRIMNLFPTVCVACPNHGHIHVRIPGLKKNMELLKNVFQYVKENELDLMKACCGYDKEEYEKVMNSDLEEWVKSYLLIGDGKQINPTIYQEVHEADSVSEIMNLLEETPAIDYDWVMESGAVTENSHRTCVNLFNLTKGETIEFRIFRASINPVEVYSSLYLSKRFVEEALKGFQGKPVLEILKEGNFKFAKLNFNEELAKGWQETRESKGRCGCLKHYTGAMKAVEDPALSVEFMEEDAFTYGILDILQLCKLDFEGKTIQHTV